MGEQLNIRMHMGNAKDYKDVWLMENHFDFHTEE